MKNEQRTEQKIPFILIRISLSEVFSHIITEEAWIILNNHQNNMPKKWVARIRNSMATLIPKFSANRIVREYTEKYHLPAAEKYLQRSVNKEAAANRIIKISMK